jgi:2'-5' RNA ligase
VPRVNLGVAITVPEPFATTLAAWRERVGDPEGWRVPPHVTLLPPTLVRAERLGAVERHLAAVAADGEPFDLHLSGTGTFQPVSDVVFVVVAAGIAQCELLEARVRSGPLARPVRFPYHPHVTVAHDVPAEQLDAAYAGLAGFDARFPVNVFTMFVQGSDGVWLPRREFPLGIR